MEYNFQMNFDTLCRICMEEISIESSENIYAQINSTHSSSLFDMLRLICSTVFIKHENIEHLPRNVCIACRKSIIKAYNLHQVCVETDRKLREIYFTSQKKLDGTANHKDNTIVNCDGMNNILELYLKAEPEVTPETIEESDTASGTKPTTKELKKLETEKIRCIICTIDFDTSECLEKHRKHVHSDGFEVQENVQTVDKPTCPVCTKIFANSRSLRRHHRKFHSGKPVASEGKRQAVSREHTCQQCEKKFRTSVGLRDHLKRHSANHPYLCTICGKGFRDNSNLRQHFLRHTGNKPFACEQCPSKFYTKAEKNAHLVTHTGEKRWACDICGSSFTMRYSLNKHKRIHSGHRPHACEFCDLRFAASDHLKRHMRIHTGERPYKCQFCDRSYSQSNDLVKHCRTHLGTDNLYQCDRCEASFRLLTELRNHYQVHFASDGKDSGQEWDSIQLQFNSASFLQKRFQEEQQRKDKGEIVSSIPANIGATPLAKSDQYQ
ncbi:zinc finger protein 154-like [Wyeomyia smithii]|uniref:zinc finger protein 154-like n=1 Tax=Wyeomyia smithii TaxID=174621 RepID=UPI002467CB8F|nr:zinc finger protein 154-like [Wyeomyia smithii]